MQVFAVESAPPFGGRRGWGRRGLT